MRRKKTFPDELIGEEAEVVEAKNQSYLGLQGRIVDETKSTFVLETKEKKQHKTLLKNSLTLKLKKSGQILVGEQLKKRPEERIKE